MTKKDLQGNRYVAFCILLVSILFGLALIKPVLLGVFWLIGWLLQGLVAIVVASLFVMVGYWLYLIEEWAFKTLFTNKRPAFPNLEIDGLKEPYEPYEPEDIHPPEDMDGPVGADFS